MDELDRLFDTAASWPPRAERSSALTIEIAHKHIGGILKRWPMHPDRLHKHLTALYTELGAYAPHLDTETTIQDFIARPRLGARYAGIVASDDVIATVETIAATRIGVPAADTTPIKAAPKPPPEKPLLREEDITVLTRLAWGESMQDISDSMGLPPATIQSRLAKAGRVLGGKGAMGGARAGLVIAAARRGLIEKMPDYPDLERPSDDQLAVLQALAEGGSLIDAAHHLGIPHGTAKSRLKLISWKWGTEVDQAYMCAIAYTRGWIT